MKLIKLILIFSLMVFTSSGQEKNYSPFSKYTHKEGLCSNSVYDIITDQSGVIWFSNSKCISSFDGLSFTNFHTKDSSFTRLYLNNLGHVNVMSSNGHIYSISGSKLIPIHAEKNESEYVLNNVIFDDSIYVSQIIPHGNYTYRNSKKKFNISKNGHFIYNTGKKLFCGSSSSEKSDLLTYISNGVEQKLKLSKASSPSRSEAIKLDNNTILYAKDFELINFNESGIISRSFVESNIQDLYQDTQGQIWVCLYNGIIKYASNSIDEDGAIRYLKNHSITSIAEDFNGDIWIGTLDEGIYVLSSQPTINYSSPKLYTDSGLTSTVIKSNIDHIQVTTESQLYEKHIPLNLEKYDSIPPKVYINNIKIMGKDTSIHDSYTLNYDQNFITIEYSGFSQGNNSKLRYRYRLRGLSDEKWIYTNATSTQYTTLPPGEYQFHVQAINKNGIWSEGYVSLDFVITPPIWQTIWFKIIVALAVMVIILIIMYFYTKTIRKKEKMQALIQQQIDTLELEALKSHMNPHFLFNTLSSIQYFITENDNKSALKYLSKFAKLMRKILDNSRQQKIPVKDELEALELYLSLEQLRFENKLTYGFSIDETINQQEDKIPSMLIQPYVENAILHGILHKNSPGRININIKKNKNHLSCEIIDDGVGREKAQEIESKKTKSHKSSGLSITKERLEILNKSLSSNMSVEIIDLKNNETPCGTKVIISIPI